MKWDLIQEEAPVVHLYQACDKINLRLYPAFGEVLEVDLQNDLVLVNLLESSITKTLGVPFKEDNIELPSWMKRIGQEFEARATLSAKNANEFYIGDFELIEVDEEEDYFEALRRKAIPTHEFRF